MTRKTLICATAAVLPAGAVLAQTAPAPSGKVGVCSYYARMHNGHITAGGEKFDSNAMTAAHRTLPLGTRLKVTNLANNRSVVVTVNDRGPFTKGRELSVTRRGAQDLGFVRQGLAKVRIEPAQ